MAIKNFDPQNVQLINELIDTGIFFKIVRECCTSYCVCILTYFLLYLQTLSHCELITDEGIRHLGGSPCATEHLQVLELDNCPLITDASLDHLMGCQGLERIELYDCQLITRAGIRKLRVSAHTQANCPGTCNSSDQRECPLSPELRLPGTHTGHRCKVKA